MTMSEPLRITSKDNPLLQRLRKLARDGGGYRKSGELWLEGEHLCSALLQRGHRPAQALLAEDRGADAIEHLEACARKRADWMMPRIMLGKTLLALGRRPEAKPWLEDALQLAVAQDHQDPEAELRTLLSGW